MRVVGIYSHMSGLDVIQNRFAACWQEVLDVIAAVDANTCRTKESREARMAGKMLYSPAAMNALFKNEFAVRGWDQSRVSHAATSNQEILSNIGFFSLSYEEQKALIDDAEGTPLRSYNQTDFVKDNVAVEVQFGKYAFIAFDIFVKHLAFFQQGKIAVGLEILPMKELQQEMSSGVAYYEGEIFNLARHGKTSPPVPLIIVGIAQDVPARLLPE